MTTDEFLKKYDDDDLTDEDLEAIHYEIDFIDTDKSYWEITENGEYGKIYELKHISI